MEKRGGKFIKGFERQATPLRGEEFAKVFIVPMLGKCPLEKLTDRVRVLMCAANSFLIRISNHKLLNSIIMALSVHS
jgi:hypothetical protein